MKKLMAGLAVGAFATVLGVGLAPFAVAQSENENSTFTVTEPLEVGLFTLQPGTYLIRVVMRASDRYTIQVTDVERTKVFATTLTVPHENRQGEAISSTRYVYYPATPGHGRALRTWFPRDSDHGHDIVYPTRRAMELASVAKEPVIAVPDAVQEAELPTAKLAVVTPDQNVKPYEVVVIQKTPDQPMVAAARPRMPKTASSVPLWGALGLLSLGGAFALRALANRSA
jgi:hypothetical protein